MRTDAQGRGYVNVLAAEKLINSPRLYATFLLWLLSELFEELPEVGDPGQAQAGVLLRRSAPAVPRSAQAAAGEGGAGVRLIRSKGVGIYFVTQNPADIPDTVLAQLGNRVQHALRAYTPADQKGLRAAAQSFRPNPAFETAEAIQALGVGEALVSTLDERGAPSITQRCLIRPPMSRVGPATDAERQQLLARSPLAGVYDEAIDRDSAHERLRVRAEELADAEAGAARAEREARRKPEPAPAPAPRRAPARTRQTATEALASSFVRSVGSGWVASSSGGC
jgi:DNA helicase HerA-like ATPase